MTVLFTILKLVGTSLVVGLSLGLLAWGLAVGSGRKEQDQSHAFLVRWIAHVGGFLANNLTVGGWIRKIVFLLYAQYPDERRRVWDGTVEWYCLLNLALGITVGSLIFGGDMPLLWDLAFFWALLRIWEIIITETDVVLFAGRRHAEEQLLLPEPDRRRVRSHRRLVILLLINFAEICVWFSFVYRQLARPTLCAGKDHYCTFADYLYLSLYTMGNLSVPDVFVSVEVSRMWFLLQPIATLLLLLLTLAAFVSYLPRPDPEDPSERWEHGL